MNAALLIIDVQQDFLKRPGQDLEPGELVARIGRLLGEFRRNKAPIFHIQTAVKADGSDGMPHWKSQHTISCREGTPGADAPAPLRPCENETVVRKRSFSSFENGILHQVLQSQGIDTVVLAGLYTHGCIRASALDAYALGYRVRVAGDAVASTEPAHAEFSRQWMDAREMHFLSSSEILAELGWGEASLASDPATATVETTVRAQPAWAALGIADRAAILRSWADRLAGDQERLARLLATEIGKPLTDSVEEVDRAIAHIACCIRLAESADTPSGGAFRVCYRPVGTVALITPWNNPLAISAGKIAPALALGNTVVWKPSPAAPRASAALGEHLAAAGLPEGVLSMVEGGHGVVRSIIGRPGISAVSFTGSNRAGQVVSALCAARGIPLQAELGGNNAAIVLADADLDLAARSIAFSAFGFAGQRCTATRRIIVEKSAWPKFQPLLVEHIRGLKLGDPLDPATQVGPLISREHLDRVSLVVNTAIAKGDAQLLLGGEKASGLDGNSFQPTLLITENPLVPIMREETFGPVAVVVLAEDFTGALALCNSVEQGLVAILFSASEQAQQTFLHSAQAGILRINPARHIVHPEAPFLGWKSSGLGPAEHGRWDLEFYAKPQAIYA
jgi:acyl-CoA reductase-like NAD-dependent aldehyde dehydrogenase